MYLLNRHPSPGATWPQRQGVVLLSLSYAIEQTLDLAAKIGKTTKGHPTSARREGLGLSEVRVRVRARARAPPLPSPPLPLAGITRLAGWLAGWNNKARGPRLKRSPSPSPTFFTFSLKIKKTKNMLRTFEPKNALHSKKAEALGLSEARGPRLKRSARP